MRRRKKIIKPEGQLDMFEQMGLEPEKEPATPLMKRVAEAAPNVKNIKKVFTKADADDIFRKIEEVKKPENEGPISRDECRRIKGKIKEMEKVNRNRLYAFPSYSGVGPQWYKMMDTSALYFAYNVAARIGRTANVKTDTDRAFRAKYIVSLQRIETLATELKSIGVCDRYVITTEGVYIFELKEPISDDELGRLRQVEQTQKDRMHNVMRPKNMDPGVFNEILTVVRQLLPKVRKLDKSYYKVTGLDMATELKGLMAIYYDYADGLYTREETGVKLLQTINSTMAGLTELGEIRAWPYDTTTRIGENLAKLKETIVKDFNIKVEKESQK